MALQVGDFVKDLTFDPPEKGRIIAIDDQSQNRFIVKMAIGGAERSIGKHNLERLEKKAS